MHNLNSVWRKIFPLLILGTIAYAVSNVLAYIVATHLPVMLAILFIQSGFIPCAIIISILNKDKFDIIPSRSNFVVWVYGIGFAITTVLLFYAYGLHSLANVFPFLEGGTIVFLALDLIFHRKRLGIRDVVVLCIGVAVVFLGTYVSGSVGIRFNMNILPYAVGIILSSGIGYYALANETESANCGSKNLVFGISSIASALFLFVLYKIPVIPISPAIVVTGIAAGAALCIAFNSEILAVYKSQTGDERSDVIIRNFINNFGELDVIIVLLSSIAIGSYTANGLLGGGLILIGVLILGIIR